MLYVKQQKETYTMISEKGFDDFLDQIPDKHQKFYCCYRGIKRKDYPRWIGWTFIDNLKGTLNVSEIESEYLEILVQNFFLIRYLSENL